MTDKELIETIEEIEYILEWMEKKDQLDMHSMSGNREVDSSTTY